MEKIAGMGNRCCSSRSGAVLASLYAGDGVSFPQTELQSRLGMDLPGSRPALNSGVCLGCTRLALNHILAILFTT